MQEIIKISTLHAYDFLRSNNFGKVLIPTPFPLALMALTVVYGSSNALRGRFDDSTQSENYRGYRRDRISCIPPPGTRVIEYNFQIPFVTIDIGACAFGRPSRERW